MEEYFFFLNAVSYNRGYLKFSENKSEIESHLIYVLIKPLLWTELCPPPPSSYVEARTPSAVILETGPLGGN